MYTRPKKIRFARQDCKQTLMGRPNFFLDYKVKNYLEVQEILNTTTDAKGQKTQSSDPRDIPSP
jgi:hypothetical protein